MGALVALAQPLGVKGGKLMSKVTLTNISTATVVISVPDLHFRRELMPGRSVALERNEFDELIFDPGVDGLVNQHFLKVDGLEEDERPVVDASPIFSSREIEQMMIKNDITAFAKFIPTAQQAEKDAVVQIAIDNGITNPAFSALIKKYCDVDVISAINMKHQLEE